MGKNSFIIYTSFYNSISKMSNEQMGELFRNIFLYHLNEETTTNDLQVEMALSFFINQFKIDCEKWETEVRKRSEAGKKGAKARWGKTECDTMRPHTTECDTMRLMGVMADNDNDNDVIYIVGYLNETTNKNFKHTTNKTKSLIKTRLSEGFVVEDFKKVIDIKTSQWLNDEKFNKYLRPETLFSNKFESYLNEKIIENKNEVKKLRKIEVN